jgi:hypothetical protein
MKTAEEILESKIIEWRDGKPIETLDTSYALIKERYVEILEAMEAYAEQYKPILITKGVVEWGDVSGRRSVFAIDDNEKATLTYIGPPHWIPTTERLPDFEVETLVVVKHHGGSGYFKTVSVRMPESPLSKEGWVIQNRIHPWPEEVVAWLENIPEYTPPA